MGGHVACMEVTEKAHRILVGERDGKRQLDRHRHRWKDNIKMNL
jgi:hypothetical protein